MKAAGVDNTHYSERISFIGSLLIFVVALRYPPIERLDILGERQTFVRNSPDFVAEGRSLTVNCNILVQVTLTLREAHTA
jgi:hypothetical protein